MYDPLYTYVIQNEYHKSDISKYIEPYKIHYKTLT